MSYHFQNINHYLEHPRSASWPIFCKYLQFVELSLLQCIAGVVTAALMLKHAKKRPLIFPKFDKKIMVVVLGHLTGTLALNAALSMHTVHVQKLFQTFEPLMVYILLTCKGYNVKKLHVLFGCLFISTGFYTFVRQYTSVFSQWGMVAATVSLFMFPLRNVYLQSFGETSKDPVEKYLMVSGYSCLILLPISLIKLAHTRIVPLLNPIVALESVTFYVLENLISFFILEFFCPLFHSVLGTLIQYSISLLTVLYLSLSITWPVAFGIMLFVVGLVLYYKKCPNINTYDLRKFLLICVLFVHLIFGGNVLWNATEFNTNSDIKQHTSTVVQTFWVYNNPPSRDIFLNLKEIYRSASNDKLHIFCGTFSCLRKVRDLENHRLAAGFLTFNDFVRNSPVEKWFKGHSLHKIISRNQFENHLHEATRLALLWRYGGTFVDPFLRIREESFREKQKRNSWVTKCSKRNSLGVQYACRFEKHHPFVKLLSEVFMKLYYQLCYLKANCDKVLQNFDIHSWNAFVNFCSKNTRICPDTVEISSQQKNHFPQNFTNTFEKIDTNTLSVGIENIAITQFIPYVNKLKSLKSSKEQFPRARGSRASWDMKVGIFDSVSLVGRLDQNKAYLLAYIASLRKSAPVGCLDTTTVNYLRSNNIEAYLTGGISLLMKSPLSHGTVRKDIYFVNLKESIIKQLPIKIQRYGLRLGLGMKKKTERALFKSIYVFFRKIAGARLVITADINCASVSIALGTPSLLVKPKGTPKMAHDLFQMFHTWDPKNHTLNSTAFLISKLLSGKIPAVADLSLFMRLRATTWNAIRRHENVLESALKFGVVPFRRPYFDEGKRIVFHLIFTTSNKSLISLGDNARDGNVKGSFVWRHWRCIESIFYHHPLATVVIHSNTLEERIFDVLRESGYEIQVKPYRLADLAKGD